MSALDPSDIRRLKASLTRLASPHDGEIIAAAKAAERILQKAGLGFHDIGLTVPASVNPMPARTRKRRSPCAVDQLRQRISLLVHTECEWTNFERSFLTDLLSFRPNQPLSLSDKQQVLLRNLEIKAAQFSGGAA